MKILYCIPTLGVAGAERQLAYLAAALVKEGHEVHVASVQSGEHAERLFAAGVTLHDVGGRGNHDPRILLRLVRLMARLRPDVVQTTLKQMDVLGGIAALLTRTPWIVRESSAAGGYPPGWKTRLRALLGRRAAAVVANSAEGDALWRAAGARVRRVIPNGIPFEEIAQASPPATQPGRRPTILFAGRLDEGKNVATLLHALSLIELDSTAILCGEGIERDALERLAKRLGIADRIVFAGLVSDLFARMKAADVVVTLSRLEGCSNVVLEAMACGCPLVVSDIAAHRELLDDRSTIFVPADDPARAAAAIRATLLDRDAARARARAARERAERWSIEAMACGYADLYQFAREPRASMRRGSGDPAP